MISSTITYTVWNFPFEWTSNLRNRLLLSPLCNVLYCTNLTYLDQHATFDTIQMKFGTSRYSSGDCPFKLQIYLPIWETGDNRLDAVNSRRRMQPHYLIKILHFIIFKGIVSRNFDVCFLVLIDRSRFTTPSSFSLKQPRTFTVRR
jgi:hypothetical protein